MMDRKTVLDWLGEHPNAVHGDPEAVVSRCEHAVRRHARVDAWIAAKRYVAARQHMWEEGHGAHASEAFVAREVCRELASELAHHEPIPHPGEEDHLAGREVKATLEREAWEFLVPWILELARDEEHRTWREIVTHTKRRAEELIRSHHLTSDTDFDHTKCYSDVAARIARMLAEEYEEHIAPPSPQAGRRAEL